MKKKTSFTYVLLALILLAGIALLLYPTLANLYNASLYKGVINSYVSTMENTSSDKLDEIFARAREYNAKVEYRGNYFGPLSDDELNDYYSQLRLNDEDENAVMGTVGIPKISVSLPIYHGTDDTVLNSGVGHLEGTSLPIGGTSTHAVISGHRGLPSSRLFTDLDKLEVGDIFYLDILGESIYYEVDQINIVLPENVDGLKIYEGEDHCTLLTCTPYGVNTHRMFVRGKRIDKPENAVNVSADALKVDRNLVAVIIGAGLLVLLWAYFMIKPIDRKEK